QAILVVLRQFGEMVEEPRLRYALVLQVRDGKLADPKVPVRMAGPLDVKFLPQIERQGHPFAFELVHNAAVVDASDLNLAPVLRIEKLFATLLQRQNVNDCDA